MIEIFAEKYREELLSAAQGVCRKLKVSSDDIGVEINIVDEEEIRSLNKEQRNIDKVTDVLSFQNLPDVRFPFFKDDYADDIN
ncbi:MAG: rRNA maturation RNAse YbeY, partial [Clostridia bacterium]|nr:rRNA maturation RNAse YbeY [Clostridia bacterium]